MVCDFCGSEAAEGQKETDEVRKMQIGLVLQRRAPTFGVERAQSGLFLGCSVSIEFDVAVRTFFVMLCLTVFTSLRKSIRAQQGHPT